MNAAMLARRPLTRTRGLRRAGQTTVVLALLAATAAAAQQPIPPVIKYGKWAVIAASAGLTVLAARAHHRADDNFDLLRQYCFADTSRCDTATDGHYLDSRSEAYYQETLRYDRRSRNWLLAGEGALLGAAAMFVWELTRPKGPPENIPFNPKVSTVGGETRVGLEVRF
jgi:hypothetical protein